MQTGQTDGHTDGRHAVTLRFPPDAASVKIRYVMCMYLTFAEKLMGNKLVGIHLHYYVRSTSCWLLYKTMAKALLERAIFDAHISETS